MHSRNRQIKYYEGLLGENEILLLDSCDPFFKNHYSSSPLAILTGFLGSAGEAIIDKNGKITIFVDPRYHLLVEKQVYDDVEIVKMPLCETFFEALKKRFKKDTILHVPSNIAFREYLLFDKYFDLRKYEPKKKYIKNLDFNKKEQIFKIFDDVDKLSFLDKIEKFKKNCPDVSSLLVFNLDEISYLTGLRSYQTKFSSNFRSILFLDFKSSNHILFCDKISKKIKIEGLSFMELEEFEGFVSSFEKEIYIDLNEISLKNFLLIKNSKELKNSNLLTLASIRPIGAIEDLKKCFKRLDFAILSFTKRIKEGLSEYDLCSVFEEELIKNGAKCPSFKTILALGENSASIHYSMPDKNKILKRESIILLDCGGYYENGFATDITRTFYFGSKPQSIYKKIYTNVLKAFLACYLSEEKSAKALDSMAREILSPFEKDGFYFNHGLGHGIGTSVHQNPPVLSINSKDTIKPYQVHSIEPGLYGRSKDNIEFGVRIENCVYSDLYFKKISLSKFPFEEVLIDYSLLDEKEKQAVKNWQGQLLDEND